MPEMRGDARERLAPTPPTHQIRRFRLVRPPADSASHMARNYFVLPVIALTIGGCAKATTQAAATQAASAGAGAAPSTHAGAFVVRLGSDTIVVEKFARTGNAYSVEQALRSPTPRMFHTHLVVTPVGDLSEMNYMQH